MEPLVFFFSDGLGIMIPFQGVPKGRSKAFIQMDYFHIFIMYLVKLQLITPVCKVIEGCTINILCSLKERM